MLVLQVLQSYKGDRLFARDCLRLLLTVLIGGEPGQAAIELRLAWTRGAHRAP